MSLELDWWTPDRAKLLPAAVRTLEQGMSEHRFLDGIITRLFYNQGTVGNLTTALAVAPTRIPTPFLRSLEALTQANALRAVIETAGSMLVRDPDFRVQTAGSTWKVQRSARKLSQWTTGLNRKIRLPETTYQVFLDAATNRMGAFKPMVIGGKIVVERTRPDSIIYASHDPYTMAQRHGLPRAKVIAMWPKDAQGQAVTRDRLKDAPKYTPDASYLVSWVNGWVDYDLLEVCEGWHCSSGDGDPGRHVVTCGDIVLVDEEWEYDWPGLIPYRWAPGFDGVPGTPLGEQLIPYQLQLQRMDRTITEAISKLAIGRVWLQKIVQGSQTANTSMAMTDRPAEVQYYAGQQPPIIQPGIAIGREYYDRRQLMRAEMFELAGISVSQATGTREVGLNSGVAQREANEKAYSRLMYQAQTLDRALERVVYAEIALADKHFSKGGYKAMAAAPGTRLVSEIDWKAIDINEMGEYEVQARTMRSLPNHPSARAEMLQEWVKLGQLDPRRVIKLMGARDLEEIEDRASIREELADEQIAAAIDDGEYIAPEPYQGAVLAMLVERGEEEYIKWSRPSRKAPRENLEVLRRLIESARDLLKSSAPPAQVAPPASGLPPPGPPAPGAPGMLDVPPGPVTGLPGAPPPM